MRPLFADPKTDFVFKKIFGSEEHKPLLTSLLNGLLELDEAHRVVQVELLTPEQRPHVQELKHSIVDVKCTDARGHPRQEDALLEACTDVATLKLWFERALTAPSAREALR